MDEVGLGGLFEVVPVGAAKHVPVSVSKCVCVLLWCCCLKAIVCVCVSASVAASGSHKSGTCTVTGMLTLLGQSLCNHSLSAMLDVVGISRFHIIIIIHFIGCLVRLSSIPAQRLTSVEDLVLLIVWSLFEPLGTSHWSTGLGVRVSYFLAVHVVAILNYT